MMEDRVLSSRKMPENKCRSNRIQKITILQPRVISVIFRQGSKGMLIPFSEKLLKKQDNTSYDLEVSSHIHHF